MKLIEPPSIQPKNISDVDFLQHRYEREKNNIAILVLKVASRCNLLCTYCHWFRDETVYNQKPVMKKEIFKLFIEKLRTYLLKYEQKQIRIVFHGGEPLLLKKTLFRYMCCMLKELEQEVGTQIKLGITTNGVLVDQEWADLFQEFSVGVSISVDANSYLHDKYRPTLKGKGSYVETAKGIHLLQKNNINNLSVLGVFSESIDPEIYCDHYINQLNIKRFDILIPNNNQDDMRNNLTHSIADFYIKLFDLWCDQYWYLGIHIRIIEAFVRATFGLPTKYPGIGVCPIKVVCLTTDGDFELHDVLRINGSNEVKTNFNIQCNELEDVFNNRAWLNILKTSLTVPTDCIDCQFKNCCRGGNVIHRYSSIDGYDNSSIYCNDFKRIYRHIVDNQQNLCDKGIIQRSS